MTQEKQKAKFGFKVNVSTLEQKGQTIEHCVQQLGLTNKDYVIGLDTHLAKRQQQPHYHIHWEDTRSYSAIQQHKKRTLPQWGCSTKAYAAKPLEFSELYAWLGYAVKERLVYASAGWDMEQLMQHAHTQKVIKESKLKWRMAQDHKEEERKSLEDDLFERLDKSVSMATDFVGVAVEVSRNYYLIVGKTCIKSRIQQYTYDYMFKRGFITHEDYIFMLFR